MVLAAAGYPASYDKGMPISGCGDAGALDGVTVFHAGRVLVSPVAPPIHTHTQHIHTAHTHTHTAHTHSMHSTHTRVHARITRTAYAQRAHTHAPNYSRAHTQIESSSLRVRSSTIVEASV